MFEIGIPNFIKASEFATDPLKYSYFKTYKRGEHVVLVSHDGEFFSFLDIATTLKRFGVLSLFIIIVKNPYKDEYTFFIGNSVDPYDRALLHKSIIFKDDTFESKLHTTKKYIEMVMTLSNSKDLVIFPVGIDEKEVKELLGDLASYNFMDLSKYLIFTPIIEPIEKKIKPILVAVLVAGAFFYASSYVSDYFKYDKTTQLNMQVRKSKQAYYDQLDLKKPLQKRNTLLNQNLKDKDNVKVYNRWISND